MNLFFEKHDSVVSQLVNHFMNRADIQRLSVYGAVRNELDDLYGSIQVQTVSELKECDATLVYIVVDSEDIRDKSKQWIRENQYERDIIVYFRNDKLIDNDWIESFDKALELEAYSELPGSVYLLGKTFRPRIDAAVPNSFKVLAIVHCYNEEDVIEKTVKYLLEQGIDVYVVDNWSDDGGYQKLVEIQEQYPNRVFLERFPASGRTEFFEWYHQLERTEEISKALEYDWYIHYDADEMRVSPWERVTLYQTIYQIDRLGYNLIENTVIDFKLTQKACTNIFMQDTYFDFGHRPAHFEQVKTWKKSVDIDLKKSGGHIATIANPRIFPLKILNRHYPLRSIEQAERKIYRDRLPRFAKEQALRGWHGHYNAVKESDNFLCDKEQLLLWGEMSFRRYYIPLFTGCGVRREVVERQRLVASCDIADKQIVLYGAGGYGVAFYETYCRRCNVVAWVDSGHRYKPSICCKKIESPAILKDLQYDFVVIAIKRDKVYEEIYKELRQQGVLQEKIIRTYVEV